AVQLGGGGVDRAGLQVHRHETDSARIPPDRKAAQLSSFPSVSPFALVRWLAGLVMTLFTLSHGPQARRLAHDCGLVTCGASLPSPVLGTAVPSAAHSTAAALRHARPPGLAPAVHRPAPPPPPPTPPGRPPRPQNGPAGQPQGGTIGHA